MRYGHKSLYNMTDAEFTSTRDNIKSIFDQIDATTMFQNPDIENFDRQQVKFIAHSYFKNSIWHSINPDLFAIFWLLSLDNIYVPVDVYENQLAQIQEALTKQPDQKDQARQHKSSSKAYEKLQTELETNKKRKDQFDNFLVSKKDAFPSNQKFENEKFDHEKFSLLLSQFCILPRILIDPAEAIYCAKFVHMFLKISKLKYTCTFYIPKEIIYYTVTFLQCATEQESVNLSIFIHQLILPFANWNDELRYK